MFPRLGSLFRRIELQDSVIVNKFIIIPLRVVLSLIVMDYRAVVVPAYLRFAVRLDVLFFEAKRFEGQSLESCVNCAVYRDGLRFIVKHLAAGHKRAYGWSVHLLPRKDIEMTTTVCPIRKF